MLVFFHLSIICCFGYYQKIIERVIVLEIYVTRDVISSKIKYSSFDIMSSMQSFANILNTRKSPGGHAKTL